MRIGTILVFQALEQIYSLDIVLKMTAIELLRDGAS